MNICFSKNEIKKYSKYRVSSIMAYFLDHIIIKITHRNRIFVFSILAVFYLLQLVLFRIEKDSTDNTPGRTDDLVAKQDNLTEHYVEAINCLMLITSIGALILGWMRPTHFERLCVFLNSILFGLSFGWLVLVTKKVRLVPIFYALNAVIAIWLLIMDVFSQLYVKGSIKLKNPNKNAVKSRTNAGFKSKHKFHTLEDETTINFSTPEQAMRKGAAGNLSSGRLAAAAAAGLRVRSPGSDDPEDELIRDSELVGSGAAASSSSVPSSRSHTTASSSSAAKSKRPSGTDVDAAAENGSLFDGFRVNMLKMPLYGLADGTAVPRDLDWNAFHNVEHRLDSSSCHIYTAYWDETPVILKLIKADRLTSAVAVAEFDTEENVLSRIRHNNIVQLLGSGKSPRKFLVLELLAGGSLSHALGVRPDSNEQIWAQKYSLLETLNMARDLANALHYLHNQYSPHMHVIHRDLKPDNIGFTVDGTVKLFDFGLCATVKAQREKSEQYKLTGNTGTLRYMAPEVVLGRSYNQTVDVYSFSILVWQIATGKVPFANMGKKQYFDRIVIGGERPRLEKTWPEAFKQLLVDCWQEDKNLRPSFAAVVRELDALVAEEERIELGRRERVSHKCYSTCRWVLAFFRPMWLLLAVIVFLYALTIIIRDSNFQSGAILCIFSTFFVYGIALSYLNVWPYVVSHKAHAGNLVTGLEVSHATTTNNNAITSPPPTPSRAVAAPIGQAAPVNDSSVSSTYSKNSNSTSAAAPAHGKAGHASPPPSSALDIESGYAFNPINTNNKVAQRNTAATAQGSNLLV